MEVLLLQDIKGVGKKNDLLVVGDGFALNCLLPQRTALVATPTVRRRYADQIKKRAVEKETEKQAQQQAATLLAGKALTFKRKASKNGKLYAGLTAENIVTGFQEQHGLEFKTEDVLLDEHIKNVGTHSVQVKVGPATQAVTVNVVKEEEKA
jgi:large subunit ribosomal protein L9